MTVGWRVVDCSTMEGELTSRRGALVVVSESKSEVVLPIADIAILLVGNKVKFNVGTMQRLAKADVSVLFTDWRNVPVAGAYGWSDHTRLGARQLKQAQASLPRRKALWADLVRAKVRGQAATLEATQRPGAARLKILAKSVRSGDPNNVEAQAARTYWNGLFDSDNFMREPGSGCGQNACLDYGYMVVRGVGIRAVLASGLNPVLGVFHRGRSNSFNLVDDLIEPFRPIVDQIVASMPEGANPGDKEVRARLVGSINQQFSENGYSVATEFEKLAQRTGMYFEGRTDKVRVPTWDGCLDRGLVDEID